MSDFLTPHLRGLSRRALRPLAAQAIAGGLQGGLAAAFAAIVERLLRGGDLKGPLALAAGIAAAKLVATAAAVRSERRLLATVEGELRGAIFLRGARAVARGDLDPERLAVALVEDVPRLADECFAPRILLPRRLAPLLPILAAALAKAPALSPLAFAPLVALGGLVALFRRLARGPLGEAAAARAHAVARHLDRARNVRLLVAHRAVTKVAQALRAPTEPHPGRVEAIAAALSGANELVALAGLAGLVALAGREALAGAAPALVPLFLAYRPVRELADARLALARGELRRARLTTLLGAASEDPSAEGANDGGAPEGTPGPAPLRLAGVRPHTARFAPLTVTIPAGAIAVLTGPTGIGKSALLGQILGITAGEGSVDTGGVAVGWLPQEAPVLLGDVRENLLGAAWPPALPRPSGLLEETALGGDGRALSGGERQWLGLARAIAAGPALLLLDEPTAALDEGAERAWIALLEGLRGRHTILLVTHRPAPLALADVLLAVTSEGGEKSGTVPP